MKLEIDPRLPLVGSSGYESRLAVRLVDLFRKIAHGLNRVADGHLDESTAAPAAPTDGDIRFADGTIWNPGSGRGFYGYYSGAWHFLG